MKRKGRPKTAGKFSLVFSDIDFAGAIFRTVHIRTAFAGGKIDFFCEGRLKEYILVCFSGI
jgi:hypothetical protein